MTVPLNVFNIVTGIKQNIYQNKTYTYISLTKLISCKCKCTFDGRKCNLNQKSNIIKCRCECKNLEEYHVFEKDYIWKPATCTCEHGKYLTSIIDNSVIACDKIIEATKNRSNKKYFNENHSNNKHFNKFIYLLIFLLIIIALLIAISIYCYLIK